MLDWADVLMENFEGLLHSKLASPLDLSCTALSAFVLAGSLPPFLGGRPRAPFSPHHSRDHLHNLPPLSIGLSNSRVVCLAKRTLWKGCHHPVSLRMCSAFSRPPLSTGSAPPRGWRSCFSSHVGSGVRIRVGGKRYAKKISVPTIQTSEETKNNTANAAAPVIIALHSVEVLDNFVVKLESARCTFRSPVAHLVPFLFSNFQAP